MPPRKKRHGKSRVRLRRFTLGTTIKKVKLGEDDPSKCRIPKPQKTVGAIYVPTKWGGTLSLVVPKGRKAKLFYKDGTLPTGRAKVDLIKHFKAGSHEIQNSFTITNGKSEFYWEIEENKKGWYFFIVDGNQTVSVQNGFFQEHSLPNEPWNSWWWPSDDGIDPNMFDITVTYSTPPGPESGPLRKYDKYVDLEHGHYYSIVKGDTLSKIAKDNNLPSWKTIYYHDKNKDFRKKRSDPNKIYPGDRIWIPGVQAGAHPDSAWKWEWDNVRFAPGTGGTAGMCDATSMAGFEISRPSGSKTLTSVGGNRVIFREQDRLGLAAERYWIGLSRNTKVDPSDHNTYQLFLRSGSDLKADWFHRQLRKRIVDEKKGLIVYVPNWNAGVYKYQATFVAYGTSNTDMKRVKITNEMTYKSWAKWIGTDTTLTTIYDLEYADDGTILREKNWSNSPHPRPTRVHYSRPTAPLWNPKVDKSKLEAIIK